jgi:hypothetical protein
MNASLFLDISQRTESLSLRRRSRFLLLNINLSPNATILDGSEQRRVVAFGLIRIGLSE